MLLFICCARGPLEACSLVTQWACKDPLFLIVVSYLQSRHEIVSVRRWTGGRGSKGHSLTGDCFCSGFAKIET